jgi:hypothetical protein
VVDCWPVARRGRRPKGRGFSALGSAALLLLADVVSPRMHPSICILAMGRSGPDGRCSNGAFCQSLMAECPMEMTTRDRHWRKCAAAAGTVLGRWWIERGSLKRGVRHVRMDLPVCRRELRIDRVLVVASGPSNTFTQQKMMIRSIYLAFHGLDECGHVARPGQSQ